MAEVAVPQTLFREILDRIRQLFFLGNTCGAGMMCGTVENQFVEWRATVAVCQNSEKKRVLDVRARLFGGSCGTVC